MATAVDANHQAVVLARQHARFSRRLSPLVCPDAGPRRYRQPGGSTRMRRRPDQLRDPAPCAVHPPAGWGTRRHARAHEPRRLARPSLGNQLQPAAQPKDHLGAAAFIRCAVRRVAEIDQPLCDSEVAVIPADPPEADRRPGARRAFGGRYAGNDPAGPDAARRPRSCQIGLAGNHPVLDADHFEQRNQIGRCRSRPTHVRAIASRCDKRDDTLLAPV